MYYQNYEDYMRSVLGYPMENLDTYGMMNYTDERSNFNVPYQDTKELEDCFPEVFRIISPIVCDVCDNCTRPVTRVMVDNMVEEVFRRIEINNEISIKINIDNRSSENEEENRNSALKTNAVRNTSSESVKRNTEVENRQIRRRNPFLRDLIRILILQRLLGGGFFPGRPPFRPRPPMRPPFPGGPGGGMPRPPRPGMRDYDEYLKF